MSSDMKRIRTFLAYRGFQWAPLSDQYRFDTPSTDFMVLREGEASIIGAVISFGEGRAHDSPLEKIVVDDEKRADLRSHLAHLLESADRRLLPAATAAALPKLVAVVNRDPICQFEDLTAALEQYPTHTPSTIDLLIWFDEFRNDRMLFRRSDPAVHQKLFNWFHVA